MGCTTLRTHRGTRRTVWLVCAIALILSPGCNKRTGSGGSSDTPCNSDECKVTQGDGGFGASFGAVVAKSATRLAVGAPDDSQEGTAAGAVFIFEQNGDSWDLEQKIVADDAAETNRFGAAIDLDGDVLIVGSRGDDTNGAGAGAAYIFRHDGDSFVQEQKLLASDGGVDDAFGQGVAVSGTTAVVGAPLEDSFFQEGAIYVFSFGGVNWTEDQKITASDAAPFDFFGYSVATDGTSISVGAPYRWIDPPEFDPSPDPNNTPANNFAVVGLQRYAGAGYIYRWDGASFTDEVSVFARRDPRQCEIDDLDFDLHPETSVPILFEGDLFGLVTDVDGELVVFGAPFGDQRVNQGNGCRQRPALRDVGGAYVYRWNGVDDWEFDERIVESDEDNMTAITRLGFGVSVVDGPTQRALIGSPADKRQGTNAGAAYLYEYDATGDTWDEAPRLHSSDIAEFNQFGSAVSVEDDSFAVGAVGDRGSGVASGAAYVYED